MNIVLIGYRGTGKSTVAGLLAAHLDWPLYSMDGAIVEETGMSIPQIVEKHGWDFFRDIESGIARQATAKNCTVIDAGGGVIVSPANIPVLRQNSVVVWLQASPASIAERIKDDAERPSLTGRKSFIEEIEEVLRERTPKYQEAADLTIDTTRCSPEKVTAEILERLRGKL